MMSAQCDWRGRLPALAYPAISARLQPLAWPLDDQRPFVLRAGCRDLTVFLVAILRWGRRSGLHGSSLCRANLARSLRVHFAVPRDS
jgi:hypothetical protein